MVRAPRRPSAGRVIAPAVSSQCDPGEADQCHDWDSAAAARRPLLLASCVTSEGSRSAVISGRGGRISGGIWCSASLRGLRLVCVLVRVLPVARRLPGEKGG
jgi:hypothetical protein